MTTQHARARLMDYTPWILRDYFTNHGPATGLVLLLVGFATVGPGMAMAGQRLVLGEVPEPVAAAMLQSMVERLSFLGAFFATNGIVANDRKLGYYRFLFAKPVKPDRYYALTFLLYGLGLTAVAIALALIWGAAVRPAFTVELFLIIALMYLAYGGLGFLLSAAWRFDWLSLVSVLLVANIGWLVWGNATGIRHWVLYLLPPVHRDDQIFALLAQTPNDPLPWLSIIWLGGYGLICFVLGMFVIRRRPLGTS
jgi:hypothetical protein